MRVRVDKPLVRTAVQARLALPRATITYFADLDVDKNRRMTRMRLQFRRFESVAMLLKNDTPGTEILLDHEISIHVKVRAKRSARSNLVGHHFAPSPSGILKKIDEKPRAFKERMKVVLSCDEPGMLPTSPPPLLPSALMSPPPPPPAAESCKHTRLLAPPPPTPHKRKSSPPPSPPPPPPQKL